jgi:hypothetical protein
MMNAVVEMPAKARAAMVWMISPALIFTAPALWKNKGAARQGGVSSMTVQRPSREQGEPAIR